MTTLSGANKRERSPSSPKSENGEAAINEKGRRDWNDLIDRILQEGEMEEQQIRDSSKTSKQHLTSRILLARRRQDYCLNEGIMQYVRATQNAVEKSQLKFIPQIPFDESFLAKPHKAYETDVFQSSDQQETVSDKSSNKSSHESENTVNFLRCGDMCYSAIVSSKSHQKRETDAQNKDNGHLASNSIRGQGMRLFKYSLIKPLSALSCGGNYNELQKKPDFSPIILVPSAFKAAVQLINIKGLLEEGIYRDPRELYMTTPNSSTSRNGHGNGSVDQDGILYDNHMSQQEPQHQRQQQHNIQHLSYIENKPNEVVVSPVIIYPDALKHHQVSFTEFRVLDDPEKVTDWRHVCAVFVHNAPMQTQWQFENYFPADKMKRLEELHQRSNGESKHKRSNQKTEIKYNDPAVMFSPNGIKGFFPFFEEDKVNLKMREWAVHPVVLTRKATKQYSHMKVVSLLWQQLYNFLDAHPFFRLYTIKADVRRE